MNNILNLSIAQGGKIYYLADSTGHVIKGLNKYVEINPIEGTSLFLAKYLVLKKNNSVLKNVNWRYFLKSNKFKKATDHPKYEKTDIGSIFHIDYDIDTILHRSSSSIFNWKGFIRPIYSEFYAILNSDGNEIFQDFKNIDLILNKKVDADSLQEYLERGKINQATTKKIFFFIRLDIELNKYNLKHLNITQEDFDEGLSEKDFYGFFCLIDEEGRFILQPTTIEMAFPKATFYKDFNMFNVLCY